MKQRILYVIQHLLNKKNNVGVRMQNVRANVKVMEFQSLYFFLQFNFAYHTNKAPYNKISRQARIWWLWHLWFKRKWRLTLWISDETASRTGNTTKNGLSDRRSSSKTHNSESKSLNVGDVKMTSVMPTGEHNRILGHKIFYRIWKLKINSMNTSWQRKITSIGIKSVIFTGRTLPSPNPPLWCSS